MKYSAMQGIELEIVEEAEQSGFVDESNIDWNNLSAFAQQHRRINTENSEIGKS